VNYQAIRAYERLATPIVASYEEGAAADHAIDCGEFSAAGHWYRCADDLTALVARVAERFGVDAAELNRQIAIAAHERSDRAMAAMMERAR
jgi:hypothetical protein